MRWLLVVASLAAASACGGETLEGPFAGLPVDGKFEFDGLTAPVHVARDKYGIAHIAARTVGDAAFVQGYVMAHDRLPQMDILRRFGAGTLAELFGGLDPGVIETDLEMRMHRMTALAEIAWTQLQVSPDPADVEIVTLLQRYADGVNAYAADLQAGKWALDPLIVAVPPEHFVPWTPIDSLVLGRFQAFALSWSTPFELDLTDLYQKLRDTYENPARTNPLFVARRGITRDLMTITPVGLEATIDGFPNVTADTGSRSDGGAREQSSKSSQPAAPVRGRPAVPQAVLDDARSFFAHDIHTGPLGALGPHAFMRPHAGSNNWAVGPVLTGGPALLASDQHLQLPNPSIFYPTHLVVQAADGSTELDLLGVTFPGIPGVILGTNGDLAWSATVSQHDVNDVYQEHVTPCGAASCVELDGQQVPIQVRTEEIKIGALGLVFESRPATYEMVPHHGPIIPRIVGGQIVPRSEPSRALSVRYTGYQPTLEIRALWKLGRAKTVQEGFVALADFTYGSQNWTMIDRSRTIGWTTESHVPERQAAAYQWNAATRPDAAAPFFILDGRGGHEWERRMSTRYVPHAIDPPTGYLATANADPVGETFDGDALNGPIVDGRPLYVGAAYAAGVREERIGALIRSRLALTTQDMEAFQHDSSSTVGAKLAPPVRTALGFVGAPSGAPSDVAPYLAGLSAGDTARLMRARALLDGWSFATPAALDAPDPDSAATAVFNAWMHFFLKGALEDELVLAGFTNLWRLDDNQLVRIVHAMLNRPQTLTASPISGQPILCDRVGGTLAAPSEVRTSCTKLILETVLLAMQHLESAAGFGSANVEDWRWGKLHTLTIEPLFPTSDLELPTDAEAAAGFPKPGDNFVVNRADQGWDDLDFSQSADGPAQRFIAIADGGNAKIRVRWQLPGGVIFDTRSPHYRDLLDDYYLTQTHFDAPYTIDEIVRNGESRWEFR